MCFLPEQSVSCLAVAAFAASKATQIKCYSCGIFNCRMNNIPGPLFSPGEAVLSVIVSTCLLLSNLLSIYVGQSSLKSPNIERLTIKSQASEQGNEDWK